MNRNLISQEYSNLKILELKTVQGTIIVPSSELVYVKAYDKHSFIGQAGNQSIVEVYHSLKWFTENLLTPVFFRCHDSYLVNLGYFECLSGGEIVLINDIKVPLARNKKVELNERLKLMFNHLGTNHLLRF